MLLLGGDVAGIVAGVANIVKGVAVIAVGVAAAAARCHRDGH